MRLHGGRLTHGFVIESQDGTHRVLLFDPSTTRIENITSADLQGILFGPGAEDMVKMWDSNMGQQFWVSIQQKENKGKTDPDGE
jgi:hypothetical protein